MFSKTHVLILILFSDLKTFAYKGYKIVVAKKNYGFFFHLKTFAYKGWKIAAQKELFSGKLSLISGFVGIGATIRIGQEMLCVLYAGFKKIYIW